MLNPHEQLVRLEQELFCPQDDVPSSYGGDNSNPGTLFVVPQPLRSIYWPSFQENDLISYFPNVHAEANRTRHALKSEIVFSVFVLLLGMFTSPPLLLAGLRDCIECYLRFIFLTCRRDS